MVQTPKRYSSDDGEDFNTDISSSSRKCNKPLMERKRRARINDSLNQLKALVLQACGKDESNFSKLDKADILEMTVKHISTIQHPGTSAPSFSMDSSKNFAGGFSACAKETLGLLSTLSDNSGNSLALQSGLFNHLATAPYPSAGGSVSPIGHQGGNHQMSYAKQQQLRHHQNRRLPPNVNSPQYSQNGTMSPMVNRRRHSSASYHPYSRTHSPDPRAGYSPRTAYSPRERPHNTEFSRVLPQNLDFSSPSAACNQQTAFVPRLTPPGEITQQIELPPVKQEPLDSHNDFENSRDYSDSASEGSTSPLNSSGSSSTDSKAWRPW